MININELVAGRRASFIHQGEVETVAKKRDGRIAPEWLTRATVTRRGVFSGNVADERTYSNFMQSGIDAENQTRKSQGLKPLPKYKSSGESWFRHHEDMAGIVLHKVSEKPYLCVLHPRVQKAEYFVNGIPATPEQIEVIREFKKGHKSQYALFALDKVQCAGYIEDESEDFDIGD